MRIVAINGSHRGGSGHTQDLLERLFVGARSASASCETVVLAERTIHRCTGCGECHTEGSCLHCVYEDADDVAAIFATIAAADVVVYATPVYVFGISSLLKSLLERLYSTGDVHRFRVTRSGLFFHDIDEAVCSRPFVSLVTCDNLDPAMMANARHYFRTYARFMDAPHVGDLARGGGRLFGHGRVVGAAGRLPKVEAARAAFEDAGRELARDGRIARRTQRAANQQVIPVPIAGALMRSAGFKRRIVGRAQEFMDA